VIKREKPTDSLRRAIAKARANGTTLYRIAADCGVDYSTMHKFVNHERGISVQVFDKLCVYLGLVLRSR
jgi:hypothetical protein